MSSCCKTHYNHTFDLKRARKEMDNYLEEGPKRTTKFLLEPLQDRIQPGYSLLDIGGGVGALILELLENGITKVGYVDISDAYCTVFREQLIARAMENQMELVAGDFTKHHEKLSQADMVTMDKVICCYEDFTTLMKLSLQKARKLYAYTIPMDVWWVKLIHWIEDSYKKLVGSHLRTHIHPVEEIEKLVLNAGFSKVYQKAHTGWLTVVYAR